jgi:nucleoside diphosphate kinase
VGADVAMLALGTAGGEGCIRDRYVPRRALCQSMVLSDPCYACSSGQACLQTCCIYTLLVGLFRFGKFKTLALLKPDAVSCHYTEVKSVILAHGFDITAELHQKILPDRAIEFFADYHGRPDFEDLVGVTSCCCHPYLITVIIVISIIIIIIIIIVIDNTTTSTTSTFAHPSMRLQIAYVTSGPVVAMMLEREGAIPALRRLTGPPDVETGQCPLSALYGHCQSQGGDWPWQIMAKWSQSWRLATLSSAIYDHTATQSSQIPAKVRFRTCPSLWSGSAARRHCCQPVDSYNCGLQRPLPPPLS